MSIKLIAVDIDGTLVNSQKEITPEVFSAIQDAKEAGVKVVIATGRPIAGVAKLLDDLQLRDQGDYVVTFNGALVQETDTGHEIISESSMLRLKKYQPNFTSTTLSTNLLLSTSNSLKRM